MATAGSAGSTRTGLEAHARLAARPPQRLAQPLAQEERRVLRAARQQEAPPLPQLRVGRRIQRA